MRVGITGHQRLEKSSDWDWTRAELENALRSLPQPLIGVSSLAIGADQLFAQLILNQGCALEAILPFDNYQRAFAAGLDRDEYHRLLKQASRVSVLSNAECDEQSYLLAGTTVVDRCELLLAVWNGQPAIGPGGTGDIVNCARQKQKPLIHFNPTTREIHSFNIDELLR